MKKAFLFGLSIQFIACGEPQIPNDTLCRGAALEDDIAYGAPLKGTGVDTSGNLKAPPEGTQYQVSTTYLRFKPDEKSIALFRELMVSVGEELQRSEGLVAFQLGGSDTCRTARTISVWESEATMGKFVVSAAHRRAMASIGQLSRGGSATRSWKGNESVATWNEATRLLGEVEGSSF